jgi:hypothetical protein
MPSVESEAEAECQIWLNQQARSKNKVISPKRMSLSLIRCREMVVCQKTKKWNCGSIHRITWRALWVFKFFIRYYGEFPFYSCLIDVPILSYGQIFRASDFWVGWQFDARLYLHYQFNRFILVSKRQFVSCMPFQSIRQARVEHLKDLDWVWCKSYDPHERLDEKSDHMTTRVMWLGQWSINNTAISSANSSNLQSSARLGRNTVWT